MPNQSSVASPERATHAGETWVKPSFELIPLDCEITAYAPDGDSPLY